MGHEGERSEPETRAQRAIGPPVELDSGSTLAALRSSNSEESRGHANLLCIVPILVYVHGMDEHYLNALVFIRALIMRHQLCGFTMLNTTDVLLTKSSPLTFVYTRKNGIINLQLSLSHCLSLININL